MQCAAMSQPIAEAESLSAPVPSLLHVTLLGDFRVVVGERTIGDDTWRLQKAKTLVKLLALAPRHRLHRDELLDDLWPDTEPATALNNLRYALHIARRTLEPKSENDRQFLHWRGEQIVLAPDGAVRVDALVFEQSAVAARRTGDPVQLQQAIDLYTGDLLPEDRYEDWAAARRETLRVLLLDLLLDLAQQHQATQQVSRSIDLLRQAIAIEPTREDAHVALMRMYASIGQRQLALRQYQFLCDVLRSDLDVDPELSTQQVYDEIASGRFVAQSSGLVQSPESARSLNAHNLPVTLTSFVGHARALDELSALLVTGRLLTITGIGGGGKSRLALALASRSVGAYRDGVWLVELATLQDDALLEQAVARVLGVAEEPDRTLRQLLGAALRDKQLLLVLDTCEHLLRACAELATALLITCPHLHVLATSRAALNVPGEITWPIAPLELPELAEVEAGPESLLAAESTRLFVERARFRNPAFAVTVENAPVIAAICRRVEGIPLAIELAAARVAMLTVEEIAARLDRSLQMLVATEDEAALTARHRSLWSMLDWSYQMLSVPEQTLLARLSVFVGGWTLAAVESVAVAAAEDVDAATIENITDLLFHLVDQSLVVAGLEAGAVTRYRYLEPVFQFARAQLATRADADAVQQRHASWCMALAERAEPELSGNRQAEWLAQLDAEHDNVRGALSWSLQHDPDTGGRLVRALWRFWWIRGHLSEGERWIERFLAVRQRLTPGALASALQAAGSLAWARGDYDRSLPLIEEALQRFREVADATGIVSSLSALGSILANQGDYGRAQLAHEEGLALARDFGDTTGIATALGNLADIAYYQGDFDLARSAWEESLALQRGSGAEYGIAIILNNLGELALQQDNTAEAEGLLSEALAIFRTVDFKHGIVVTLSNLADLHMLAGDALVARLLHESLSVARDVRNGMVTATCFDTVAKFVLAQRMPQDAARLFAAAVALRDEAGARLSSADQNRLQPFLDHARRQLGDDAWSAAWSDGGRMSADAAEARAIALLTPFLESDDAPGATQPNRAAMSLRLTPRERDVARRVAHGLTNREIAADLGTARRTVDTQVSSILRKLGLTSRDQLRERVTDATTQ